jgi:hypothetical protein
MYNKLKVNNFDPKLMEILAPSKPISTGGGRKKKRYIPKSERIKRE